MELELADKVAIVTGAGQGFGAAIAQTLAAAGANVAVNDINPDRAERVAAAIRAAGGQAVAIPADISNKFQCVHLVETTRAEWGRLDILVNNAVVKPKATVLKMDEWDWQRTLDVNLKGTFFMSQLVGRVMADENQEREGVIINIASDAGVQTALANHAAYAASKAAIVGFTYECAREYAAHNIRVNVLSPAENPPPTAATVAQMALFLCSKTAAHLCGVNLPVNGR
ncbi:MAG: SDR family NAD(P)-dependent oxidoreductase [Anaerolineales bacterium]|nr:SDR family NAD(P)-dependent oxidoreductase [Anaerolineales bacterium]MCA9974633.1 SDR family NAD(P)-dependent oxidoreductase [Anaerolineales bacterium]